MAGLNYNKIREYHSALILAYAQRVKAVSEHKTNFLVKAFVEDHVQKKLQELSKIYATLWFTETTIHETSAAWLRQTADDCDKLAGTVDTMSHLLSILRPLADKSVTFTFILLMFVVYGHSISFEDMLGNWQLLFQAISEHSLKIFIIGISIFIFFTYLLVYLINVSFLMKRKLFGAIDPASFNQLGGRPKVNEARGAESVYALENNLYHSLEKSKTLEEPYDLKFGVYFLGLIVVVFVILMIVTGALSAFLVNAALYTLMVIYLFWRDSRRIK